MNFFFFFIYDFFFFFINIVSVIIFNVSYNIYEEYVFSRILQILIKILFHNYIIKTLEKK